MESVYVRTSWAEPEDVWFYNFYTKVDITLRNLKVMIFKLFKLTYIQKNKI